MKFTGERYIPTENDKDELSVEHLHRYYSVLPLIKDKTVLDIACGEGYGAALFAKTAKNVVGVDISKECIAYATQKYFARYPNIRFLEGSAEKIPVEDHSFDVVVSFETIEHLSTEGQKSFLAEVKRVLKSNGVFIVSTPDKENYSDRYHHENHFHIHELSRSEFIEIIATYFNNAQLMEQGFEIISAITPTDYSNTESVRLINWQKKIQPKKRKYLLAIASDKPTEGKEVASVVLETDKDYFKQIDRIIELQNEVEDRTAWALRLDNQRVQHEATIATLKEQIKSYNRQDIQLLTQKVQDLQQWLLEQSCQKQVQIESLSATAEQYKKVIDSQLTEIAGLQDKNKALEGKQQHLKEKNKVLEEKALEDQELLRVQNNQLQAKMAALTRELKEKDQILQDVQFNFSLTRQQLSEANNRLLTIYDSEGWKALEKYYAFKGRYLHEDSKHYKLLKKTVNFLRNKKEPITVTSPYKTTEKEDDNTIKKSMGKKEIIVRALPYFEQPVVSIIIPVYNAWKMNEKCLAAIIEHTTDVAYEVIIADDCSTDETRDISKYFKNVVHIRNEKNLGFLLNCNHAATYAKGRYIHFLNNDTEVKAGWLSSLVRLLENDERIGLAGSKLIYPDGKLQEAGGIIWNDASGWNFGHKQDPSLPEYNYVKEADYISGASIMIRKRLWQEIGGFDQQYVPAYFEDTDLAFEVRKRGYKVLYQPLSVVVHYEGYSHGTDSELGTKKYQALNAEKFYRKWESILQSEHFENGKHVFEARDKSRNKKTILVIDHYVPHFDKDAGSRHTYQYLKLLTEMGYNVKFIGDNFFKHEPYTTILQQLGIEVQYGEYYRLNWQKWLIENKDAINIVYLHRPHISIKYIDFIKTNTKCKIIYFGHDLHYYREEKQYEIEMNQSLLESAKEWKKKEIALFEKSDLILTPSEKEKAIITSLSPSFKVATLPLFYYKETNKPVENFANRKNIMFIGGFNHLPNKDAILWFIKEVWPLVKDKVPEIQFIIAGSNVPEEIKKTNDSNIIVKGYVSDVELKQLYSQVRIIAIPLRYGAGIKGKTLEAMYNGIPIITTPEGIEGLPGDLSFLKTANTNQLFADNIIELYNNEEVLVENSKKSIQYINAHFTEEIAKDVITKVLTAKTIELL